METGMLLVILPLTMACILATAFVYVYYKVEMEKLRHEHGKKKYL